MIVRMGLHRPGEDSVRALTIDEAARRFGRDRDRVVRWVNGGLLPAVRALPAGRWRIPLTHPDQEVPVELLTVREAAERLSYSTKTVYRLINEGRLRAVRLKPGSPWRVPLDAIPEFIDTMETNQRPHRPLRRIRR